MVRPPKKRFSVQKVAFVVTLAPNIARARVSQSRFHHASCLGFWRHLQGLWLFSA